MLKTLHKLEKDPVFWVILPLALVLIPHIPRFPFWLPWASLILFIWRIAAIKKPRYFPRKWVLFVLVIFASIGCIIQYGTLFGKTAGTAILTFLLCVKLLESRTTRDYMLLISLSFFIIVTNFLFSQSIPTVILMFITVIILVMSMISINQNTADISIKRKLKTSTKLVVQALPLMLVLFVLFPRIPGPLWSLPDDANTSRTGLSDTMSPGNISNLIQSNALAFRVKFKETPPDQNKLYWRALVLWYFDGRTWEQGKTNRNPAPTMEGLGELTEYTVTLEPHYKKWLFALDVPAKAPYKSTYNANFLLRSENKIESLYQYTVKSYLKYRIERKLSIWEKNAGLKFPQNSNPETIALGKKWRKQFKNPIDIINHALKKYNKENFIYTLRPPLTAGFHPVDQFLFDTQRGFCGHYASSFTLLMRAAGIPARVILGYQGGTLNPLNKYLTVSQSDAHSWSEVWLREYGWVRVDPTAAIAPERIEKNLDAALSEDSYRPLYMQLDIGVLKKLQIYWDAADNSWKQWVIGYGPELQRKFLSSILNKNVNYSDMAFLLITIFAITATVILLFIFKPVTSKPIDPVQREYDKFCKKLSKQGLIREQHEGPLDFASRINKNFTQNEALTNLITHIYINLRFRSNHDDEQLKNMKRLVQKFKFSK
jgi:protein-glutamine gamma-glutamyltransferase